MFNFDCGRSWSRLQAFSSGGRWELPLSRCVVVSLVVVGSGMQVSSSCSAWAQQRCMGSVALVACGIFLGRKWNRCSLYCKVDLNHWTIRETL